jgi:hypothetical protein
MPDSNQTSHFLTPKEFMVAKNLSRNTVYYGLRNGSIPSVRLSKRKILIPEDALERKLTIRQKSTRPGYIFDPYKQVVQEFHSILDRAAVEYDQAEDVVDDFTAYLKDWLSERQIGDHR